MKTVDQPICNPRSLKYNMAPVFKPSSSRVTSSLRAFPVGSCLSSWRFKSAYFRLSIPMASLTSLMVLFLDRSVKDTKCRFDFAWQTSIWNFWKIKMVETWIFKEWQWLISKWRRTYIHDVPVVWTSQSKRTEFVYKKREKVTREVLSICLLTAFLFVVNSKSVYSANKGSKKINLVKELVFGENLWTWLIKFLISLLWTNFKLILLSDYIRFINHSVIKNSCLQ